MTNTGEAEIHKALDTRDVEFLSRSKPTKKAALAEVEAIEGGRS